MHDDVSVDNEALHVSCVAGVALLVCYCWKNSKAICVLRVTHWLIAVSTDMQQQACSCLLNNCFVKISNEPRIVQIGWE
eukprot:jgi/Botrbrau1/10608/Bobra.0358s0027.1